MKYHSTSAEMFSLAAHEGFTVCDIPEGMDPVGALVIVLTQSSGHADDIETGTITADDIKGTGPFLVFTPVGQLLGAGFTPAAAIEAMVDSIMEEVREEAQEQLLAVSIPVTAPNPA